MRYSLYDVLGVICIVALFVLAGICAATLEGCASVPVRAHLTAEVGPVTVDVAGENEAWEACVRVLWLEICVP